MAGVRHRQPDSERERGEGKDFIMNTESISGNRFLKALLLGFFLNLLLLLATGVLVGDFAVFCAVLAVVVTHIVISIGVYFYRGGNLSKNEYNFVRFGVWEGVFYMIV